jgi:hypothetical protein
MAKRTNNDLQSTTQEKRYRATQTPLNSGINSGATPGSAAPAPLVTLVGLLLHTV